MGTPSPADWAAFYASVGWRSFPVKPGAKSPSFAGWQKDATTKPDLIRQYWNGPEGAERNLGLVCGERFDAWDIEFEYVVQFIGWMESNGHSMPECPIAQTGRHGIHLLTQPTGVDHTRHLFLDGTHIGELKSSGGFILACPSETDDVYLWRHLPDRLELPAAPEWLMSLLERPQRARMLSRRIASPADFEAVMGPLEASVAHAGEGRRNNYLYWAMRRAIEEGAPPERATTILRASAIRSGLSDHEADQTIDSALHAESNG